MTVVRVEVVIYEWLYATRFTNNLEDSVRSGVVKKGYSEVEHPFHQRM